MNIHQVSEKFGYAESSIKKFKRFQQSLRKKGVQIQKIGRGAAAQYVIVNDSGRAQTIFKEDEHSFWLNKETMQNTVSFQFAVLVGIIGTQFRVFKGTYKDFLKYIQMDSNKEKNVDALKDALDHLYECGFIGYQKDPDYEDYFVAYTYVKVDKDLKIGIGMMNVCKRLAAKYNKRSWIPLLKVWLGVKYLYYNNLQPYTIKELSQLTGLSKYAVRENGRILEEDNVFKSDKVYKSYMRCLGKQSVINIIHDGAK